MATNTNSDFNLDAIAGTGEVGFVKEVHNGILQRIQKREGTYKVFDIETGEVIAENPKSAIAYFEGGVKFNWTTYEDKETGEVKLWSRFDQSINLGVCARQRIPLHIWRDSNNHMHLELEEQ
ncbi:MAG: hypothetical protein K5859_03570 [Atopobiaceae bacterium]|nr:hypothetical protein [Atopobiaceae bacterium]